jgi:hypothetical protein
MRARLISLGGMILVFVLAAPVLADIYENDIHPADQKLFHGYDPDANRLVWAAILEAQTEAECALVDEDGVVDYKIDGEGNVTVEGTEGECDFHVTDVTGPEGQVNHGTVVSSFVQALRDSGYEGGLGCFVRVIAGTDYGQDDQQVKVGDVVADTDTADEGTVVITQSETTCGKPEHAGKPENSGKPEEAGKSGTNGRPDHAEKPESPGKPDNVGKPAHAGGGKNG